MNTIYKISNTINNKFYIGQTCNSLQRRFIEHKRAGEKQCIKLHYAFNKYGRDNFIIETIAICSNQSTADYLESLYIEEYNSIIEGYNIRDGGSHGKFSKETRLKMSEARQGSKNPMYGKQRSEEVKNKIRESLIGRKHSEESKKKMSKPMSEKQKDIRRNFRHSEETKKKMSEKHSGKILTKDHKRKISESRKRKIINE